MNYFIIIRGPLGIGKSTIAKLLTAKLNAYYVSMDEILQEHGLDKIGAGDACIPAENFIKADDYVLPEIKSELAKGKSVILDGCFYHQEQIDHLINSVEHPCSIFTLKAPLEACIERDSNRSRAYGKDAATAVYNLVFRFDCGAIINTEHRTPEQTAAEIISYLP